MMTAKDLALKYMDIFFSGQDMARLQNILHKNLIFKGPLYRFNSASDYINSLLADPPENCRYKLLKIFEGNDSVNLIYNFYKDDMCIPMSQYFELRENRICKILLIFDSYLFRSE